MCLQFLVPISFDRKLPLSLNLNGKRIVIDHPSPFTVPICTSRRPPEEQDKFERWKDTANRSFNYRKGRHNSLSHCPKLADSMCRFILLRHGEIVSTGRHYPVSFETDFFPFLFVDGTPDLEDVLEFSCDVFADNKQIGQSLVSAIQQCESKSMADIHLDSASICIAEVLQGKQESLKVGRFVLSKGNYFASTSETLQCHCLYHLPDCSCCTQRLYH